MEQRRPLIKHEVKGWRKYFKKTLFLAVFGVLLSVVPAILGVFSFPISVVWFAEIVGIVSVLLLSSFFIIETNKIKNTTKVLEKKVKDQLNNNATEIRKVEKEYGKFDQACLITTTQILNALNTGASVASGVAGVMMEKETKEQTWIKLLFIVGPTIATLANLSNYLTLNIMGDRNSDIERFSAKKSHEQALENQGSRFRTHISQIQEEKLHLKNKIQEIKHTLGEPRGESEEEEEEALLDIPLDPDSPGAGVLRHNA